MTNALKVSSNLVFSSRLKGELYEGFRPQPFDESVPGDGREGGTAAGILKRASNDPLFPNSSMNEREILFVNLPIRKPLAHAGPLFLSFSDENDARSVFIESVYRGSILYALLLKPLGE
jgi:hypothetical protein